MSKCTTEQIEAAVRAINAALPEDFVCLPGEDRIVVSNGTAEMRLLLDEAVDSWVLQQWKLAAVRSAHEWAKAEAERGLREGGR